MKDGRFLGALAERDTALSLALPEPSVERYKAI